MGLSVTRGNSCLFVHARTSNAEISRPFLTLFWSSLRESAYRLSAFSSLGAFRTSRVLSLAQYFPAPYRVLLELTYFSEAFVRTAKTGDSGRRGAKSGRKKWRKKWPEDREKSDASPPQRARPIVGRIICSFGKNDSNGNTRERSG